MMPSLVARPAFLAAVARPFLRSSSRAASASPLASTRADLHSIMPAPVSSRSLRTISAEMLIDPSSFDRKRPGPGARARRPGMPSPSASGGGGRDAGSRGERPRLGSPARRFVLGGSPLVGESTLRRAGVAHAPSGQHGVGDPSREEPDGPQGVVVAGDDVVDLVRIAVGVDDADHRDLELA